MELPTMAAERLAGSTSVLDPGRRNEGKRDGGLPQGGFLRELDWTSRTFVHVRVNSVGT